LGAYQKYILPAKRLSNLPEFPRSGGKHRYLATLALARLEDRKINKNMELAVALLESTKREKAA
jgi:hypothetical protein